MKAVQIPHNIKGSSSNCDLNIVVQGKHFGAHWQILRRKSNYFEEIYQGRYGKESSDSSKSSVYLQGVNAELVGLFLQYVYVQNTKNAEHFQLELDEIYDVLKFSIMFGLKDLAMRTSMDLELDAKIRSLHKTTQQMSQLHKNLLKFLYTKTTVYKTSNLATFVALKAHTAASMKCLLEVLKIVSCADGGKITMRLRLLDVLITLFTDGLDDEVERKARVDDCKHGYSKELGKRNAGANE